MNDKFLRPNWPGWIDLRPFHMWCCATLPTVFDESMSYYEVLCKVRDILNGVIKDVQLTADELQKFEMSVNQQFEELKSGTWIQGTIPYLEMLLQQFIPVAIFFGLTDSGYFVAYIPETWDEISFATTGYDTVVPIQPEYGHLVLDYPGEESKNEAVYRRKVCPNLV